MKIKSLFYVFAIIVFAVGCSSDDDGVSQPADDNGGNQEENPVEALNYLPDNEGNTWSYSNEMMAEFDGEEYQRSATEILKLIKNNDNSILFENEVNGDLPGVFTTALTNGELKKVDGKYLYTGSLDFLNIEEIPSIGIPLENVPMFDEKASVGEELYATDDQFTQEIPVGDLGTFPVQVSYTLTIKQKDNYDSMMGYEDVKSSEIEISNVSIIVQDIPIINEIELMESTENKAMISVNYLAEGVGLIKNETTVDLPLVDLNDVIPIPMDGIPDFGPFSAFVSQELVDYQLVE